MCSNKECAEYFKNQKAYGRCFEEFRKKWRSYGKVSGRITLTQATKEERRAIGGIIGKVFYEETVQFSFSEFERGLQKTRFAPVDMKAVLEEYFGEPLVTTKGRQREAQEKKDRFLCGICQYFTEHFGRESAALLWLNHMISRKTHGYQLLIREYAKDEKQAEILAGNVGKAILRIKDLKDGETECPLAVLAAEITDNPHYFDRDTAAGQLLVHAVCFCEKMEYPQNAHQWRNLLMQVSIAPDTISSMVHAYGLRMLTKQGWHGAYDVFCKRREPYVITMENMNGIIGAQAVGEKVYVVENEMVFSYLIHNLKDSAHTLLCTSGQPRSVAQILFPYILADKAYVYYNGDMDPDGIRIADRLWKKFGDGVRIWRMAPADYEKSLSGEKIGDMGRAKLEHIEHPILRKTAECMKERLLAGYQENLLKELLEDME